MLAVDTNVVVRYLLDGEDRAQFEKAVAIIERGDVFVSTTVLLETEWVLRSVYGFGRDRVATALFDFIGLPGLEVEDVRRLRQALAWAKEGFDFADALHVAGAQQCDAFVTFDRALVKAAKAVATKPRVKFA